MHRAAPFVILVLVTSVALGAEPAPQDAPAQDGGRVVREFASRYGPVFVVDEGRTRALRFGDPDAPDQTVIDRNDPSRTPLEYVRTAALGFSFPDKPRRALLIGLGGGAFVRVVRRYLPEVKTDAVEINPVVVEVAKEYFGIVDDDRSDLFVDDGGRFVKTHTGPWDLAFLDAYDGEEVPTHLATRAFFRLVRTRLTPGGVAVLNLAVEDEALAAQIRARFASAFAGCTAVEEPEWGNVLLFGTSSSRGHDKAALARRARALAKARGMPFALGEMAAAAGPCRVPRP